MVNEEIELYIFINGIFYDLWCYIVFVWLLFKIFEWKIFFELRWYLFVIF